MSKPTPVQIQLGRARTAMQTLILICAPIDVRERQERIINRLKTKMMLEG